MLAATHALSLSLLLLSPSRRFPRSMRTATEAVLSSLVLCHLLSQPASLIATGRFRAFCAHRWRRYAPTTVSFHLEFRSPRVLQGFAIDRHRPRSRYRSRSSRALEEEWRGEEWKRRERERRGERNLWCHSMPFSIGCQRTSAVFEMSDYSPLWEFNLFHRFQFVSFSFRIFLGGRGSTWWEVHVMREKWILWIYPFLLYCYFSCNGIVDFWTTYRQVLLYIL